MTSMAELKPQHFLWDVEDGIATVRLEPAGAQEPADLRQSYAELRDTVPATSRYADDVDVVVVAGARRQLLLGRRRARDHRPARRR